MARLKLPVNYRSAASRTPTPEDIAVEGGIAILAEAPADPGDASTPMVVTVDGSPRSRVTGTPAAGEYLVRTATSPQGTAFLPVLEFHSSDEGLSGTCDYYRTGTVYTSEWFSSLLSLLTPLVNVPSLAFLEATYPASSDTTQPGRPGRLAFLADFSAYYSDGTAWRQMAGGASVVTAVDQAMAATFGATQDAIASHVGATAMAATMGATFGATWAGPGNLAGSVIADAVLGAVLDASFVPGGLAGAIEAVATMGAGLDASYSAGGGSTAFTDDFNRASLGANWTTAPGQSTPTLNGSLALNGVAYCTAQSFAADQYAECVIGGYLNVTAAGPGPRVRQSATTNDAYFVAAFYDDYDLFTYQLQLYRSGTLIGSADLDQVQDKYLRLEAQGTTVRVKSKATAGAAWTTRITVTDSAIASGSPGFRAGDASHSVDDFAAGDL